jgi:surface antigen
MKKLHTKRFVRYGLFAANAALLLAAIGFVMQSPSSNQVVRQNALAGNVETANPLDELSSSDVAVHLARMSNLPEATAVVNQADTISGQIALSSSDSKVAPKPQIVSTDVKSYQDIQVYITQPGDTIESVAAKFGVTSDSILWSNDLGRGDLQANRQLFIPPVNGIVYLVQAGDTPEKLAKDFNADKEAIVAFNDAEVRGLVVGQRIVVPGGSKGSSVYNVASGNLYGSSGGAWGGRAAIYAGNAYDYGWCTWYAAERLSVPSNWGNANTWDNYATGSGWTVSGVPVPGAVAQSDAGGWGHVGVVEEVSADGTMIRYSDMNGLAGWGNVGHSSWVPVHSKFQKFIYR